MLEAADSFFAAHTFLRLVKLNNRRQLNIITTGRFISPNGVEWHINAASSSQKIKVMISYNEKS